MIRLNDYRRIVGNDVVEKIRETAEPLAGKHVVHVNSVYTGGGVAEILNRLVILFDELKIESGWRIMKGSLTFFNLTKKFHNSLQGEKFRPTRKRIRIYEEETERNAIMNHFDHDMVIIHDPQPLALIKHYEKSQPWIWRCHIDISRPYGPMWRFVKGYLKMYDGMIISMNKYKKKIGIPQFIIRPSIDPLSPKNRILSETRYKRILSLNGIDTDKPILCQISRFDKWKDPEGVLKIFNQVRKKVDCQLVLLGDMAADDPEGPMIYHRIMKAIEKNGGDIKALTIKSDLLVNALQRKSSVVIQNSKKEGFGLVVAEALWKETPVVARRVGGIPLQVRNGKTGFLIGSKKEGIKACIKLIEDRKLRERMGKQGKEHVRKNFLITRHIQDYINLFGHYLKN
ncbi:MAG: glycosyltransferase [Candidatus Aenigmarchaeota archaeon]|nr:glycosyltransferase [Candidatus Aenigmarchaeota archaeon]